MSVSLDSLEDAERRAARALSERLVMPGEFIEGFSVHSWNVSRTSTRGVARVAHELDLQGEVLAVGLRRGPNATGRFRLVAVYQRGPLPLAVEVATVFAGLAPGDLPEGITPELNQAVLDSTDFTCVAVLYVIPQGGRYEYIDDLVG